LSEPWQADAVMVGEGHAPVVAVLLRLLPERKAVAPAFALGRDHGRKHARQGCGVVVARYVLSLSVAVVSEKNDVNVVSIELRPT
jgi:hypothetical protein